MHEEGIGGAGGGTSAAYHEEGGYFAGQGSGDTAEGSASPASASQHEHPAQRADNPDSLHASIRLLGHVSAELSAELWREGPRV